MLGSSDLAPPTCELCGPDHVEIDVYRAPQEARRGVHLGNVRTGPRSSRQPGFVFFHCSRCGLEGGCSVPDSYLPPGRTGA